MTSRNPFPRTLVPFALVLALFGCADHDADDYANLPDPAPARSATTTTRPTPPAPPALPAAAQANTPDGAKAFVAHWFDALNYGYRTNDPAPLKALSRPRCTVCTSFVESIDELRNKGQRLEGGTFTPYGPRVSVNSSIGRTFVSVFYDCDSDVIYDKDGSVASRGPAEKGNEALFELAWGSAGWLVDSANKVEK